MNFIPHAAGRVDDVINVSGHRIGTAEVEGALTTCHLCTEAAVVPVEHPIKGQGIYAFVSLMEVGRKEEARKEEREFYSSEQSPGLIGM